MFVVEYMVLVFVGLRRLLTFGVLVLTWGAVSRNGLHQHFPVK